MNTVSSMQSEELQEALHRHGLAPHRIDIVSALGEKKGRRIAYRLESLDGRVTKIRPFENEEEARRVFEWRAELEEAFAPALARYGSVLIEEWIEGVPLTPRETVSRLEPAGALLGRLHAKPLDPGVSRWVPTVRWRAAADSDLEQLAQAGALVPGEVSRLQALLGRHDPGRTPVALAHLDFCGDNMVIDLNGRLRVIDNELFAIEPMGLDLGRTFHLWSMPESWRAPFQRGYRSAAPVNPDPPAFWRVAATLLGARVFLPRSPTRLEPSIELLRRFAQGHDLEDPCC